MNKSRPIDAVIAGYLGVDITPGFAQREPISFSEMFRPGKLIETEGLHFSLGGVVANTGLAMRKFGQTIELAGTVGNDALGDLALSQLTRAGVNSGIRRTSGAGTAYGIVIAPPGMDRVFLEDAGCNRIFTADDIDFSIVGQSRLFHFGYPTLMDALWADGGSKLESLLKQARNHGAAVSLDMTLPDPEAPSGKADWRAILSTVLPQVDIFVPSIEELFFMFEPERYAMIAEQAGQSDFIDTVQAEEYELLAGKVLDLGVKIMLIKAGHKGAYLRTGNLNKLNTSALRISDIAGCPDGAFIQPMPENPELICNASGAGDCAVAGFLAALLRDESIITAGQYAMIAGRDNLYGQDALSGLREWTEMTKDL